MDPSAAPSPEAEDFTHRRLRRVGKRVHRMGIACNYGLDPDGFSAALERGANYIFWTAMRTGKITPVLREALRRDRERYVVASGPSFAVTGGNVTRGVESLLKKLGTDYLDVYQLFWVGVTSSWREATADALAKLKEQGKIRATGVSIHDRPRAAELSQDERLDLLMIRYNAAHPGAEREIFPRFSARRPDVAAYTATDWRKLLKRPSGWEGKVPDAGDCYRFALSSPHVDVVISGPGSREQMEANFDALARGPLTPDEDRWMRDLGRVVHG
jgi:aryl-alcohol dehydrogenase-like predicted oxidoreductase